MGEYGTSASDVIAETIWMSPQAANDNPFGGDDGVGGYAPLAVATGSGTSAALLWVHGNQLGVPLVYADATGAAVTTPSYTVPGFPGQLKTLSDIYYNRYRDYDSSLGRYIQADPIGLAGGSNPFGYANENPLRYTDPLGLASPSTGAVIEVALEEFLILQRSPARRSPWGRWLTIGDAIGATAAVGIFLYEHHCKNDDNGQDECLAGWLDEVNNYCPKYFKGRALARCIDRANDRLHACRHGGGHWPPNGPDRWSYQDEHGFRP